MPKSLQTVLFVLGLALLGLNVEGLFIPLRNPAIYREPRVRDADDITLTAKALESDVRRKAGESIPDYVTRVNGLVNRGIAHYWAETDSSGIDRYNLRIPPHENYLLYLASYLYPRLYRRYEFCNYRKALERGVGLCSEQVIILTGILTHHGIDTRIVSLTGHVVATALVDPARNTWWILDPDYGVVLRHSLGDLDRKPQIVRTAYTRRGYPDRAATLVHLYTGTGVQIKGSIRDYAGWKKYDIEYLSYTLIWVIPGVLILPFLLSHVGRRNIRRREAAPTGSIEGHLHVRSE